MSRMITMPLHGFAGALEHVVGLGWARMARCFWGFLGSEKEELGGGCRSSGKLLWPCMIEDFAIGLARSVKGCQLGLIENRLDH